LSTIKDILDWVKLSPKYLFPLALVTTVLLFLPTKYLNIFGVNELVNNYRPWIGIGTLILYIMLLGHLLYWLKDIILVKIVGKFEVKTWKKRLKYLSNDEKYILSYYLIHQRKSQNIQAQSGVAGSLMKDNIIYQGSALGNIMDGFAYNLQPWAWKYLNEHNELLEPILKLRKEEESMH